MKNNFISSQGRSLHSLLSSSVWPNLMTRVARRRRRRRRPNKIRRRLEFRLARLEGFRPTEITTSKRSEFFPIRHFWPAFITRAAVAAFSLSVLLLIFWSTSPFGEDRRDPIAKYIDPEENTMSTDVLLFIQPTSFIDTDYSTKILLFDPSKRNAGDNNTRPVHNKGSGNIKQRRQGRCCWVAAAAAADIGRSFSRLCYLSRRQFRSSGLGSRPTKASV